jgi:hypothetical protein
LLSFRSLLAVDVDFRAYSLHFTRFYFDIIIIISIIIVIILS